LTDISKPSLIGYLLAKAARALIEDGAAGGVEKIGGRLA
jgi:hypothetical protein